MLWILICLSSGWCLADMPIALGGDIDQFEISSVHVRTGQILLPEAVVNEITTINSQGGADTSKWFYFSLDNQTTETRSNHTWLMEIKHRYLEQLDVFLVANDRVTAQYRVEPAQPYLNAASASQHFIQPIKLQPNTTNEVYLRVSAKYPILELPLKLTRPMQRFYNELTSNHAFGLFFGVLLAMLVYNMFMLVSSRQRAYFYYIAFIASTYITFQAISGYSFLFFFSDTAALLQDTMFQSSMVCTVMMGLLFARSFIDTNHYSAKFNGFVNTMVVLGALLIGLLWLFPGFGGLPQFAYVSVICLIAPVLVYRSWRLGSRPAGFLLISWLLIGAGATLMLPQLFNMNLPAFVSDNALLLGSASEMLILSFGLADRMNRERHEKYYALREQHDVILKLKDAEDRLMHRALHSRTTGLPNRTFLRNVLEDLISKNQPPEFSLILLSLNNFHEFNKTLGHSNGDAILYLITERLINLSEKIIDVLAIEDTDDWRCCVAAVEGVNFGILVESNDALRISGIVTELLHQIEKPFEYDHLTLDVDVTAGIAMYPIHSKSSENLMRNAHVALESAISMNKSYAIYTQEIDPYNSRRISLLGELRNAIEKETLQLYFQPQISLDTQQVRSAEVLVRWNHPEYGFVPPDEFIPLAEKTGVIQPLTYLICKKAFQYKKRLDQLGLHIKLSINISARNLMDPQFKERVCQLADQYQVSLKEINMELTETAVMSDPDGALEVMKQLSEAGIQLSIDDFGTGYSCLSYLKKLPVDEIKIDRSFVMDMIANKDDKMIVLTTLIMGHNLSLGVVAEGIENESTLQALKEMGCDIAQGYHIARPMPIEDFIHWLSTYQKSLQQPPLPTTIKLRNP